MRDKLIEALAYPREMIRGILLLEECKHSGQFDPNDRLCVDCFQGDECKWLFSNDEFVALEKKPVSDIVKAIEQAQLYIDAHTARLNHDRRSCPCDSCTWLRRSHRLLREC